MTQPKIPHSPLIYGCMMIGGSFDASPLGAEKHKKGHAAVEAALECGLNYFDHADIYCCGKSETIFGEYLEQNSNLRDKLVIQSKCGICLADQPEEGTRFDLSFDRVRVQEKSSTFLELFCSVSLSRNGDLHRYKHSSVRLCV